MSPDSGCLWSISIRVLVYSGFIPGHKAGPRWLPLTREQCMTDHERLLWSQSTYTVYLCTGLLRSTYKKSSRFQHLAFSTENNINSYWRDKQKHWAVRQYLTFSESSKGYSQLLPFSTCLCGGDLICSPWCHPQSVISLSEFHTQQPKTWGREMQHQAWREGTLSSCWSLSGSCGVFVTTWGRLLNQVGIPGTLLIKLQVAEARTVLSQCLQSSLELNS